jgi:hypothetical protein
MNIWMFLSVIWAALLLFTIFAPNKWHAIVLKENTFWLKRNLISESFLDKMVKFETSIWLKVLILIGLIFFILLAFIET